MESECRSWGLSRLFSVILLISHANWSMQVTEGLRVSQEMQLNDGIHSITRAIENQTHLENSIVETFNKFFNDFRNSSDFYNQSIIYICDESCERKNAYEYGVASAFILSVLSQRKFSILTSRVFDLYEERGYKWKLDVSEILNKPGGMIVSSVANRNRAVTDLHILERELQEMNFDKAFDRDFMTLTGNKNWILDLRRHPRSYKMMPWLFRMHACDVNRLVHFGLFRIQQSLKDTLHSYLINKIGENRLICFNGQANADLRINGVLDFIRGNFNHSGYRIYRRNKNSKHSFENELNDDKKYQIFVRIEFDKLYKEVVENVDSRRNLKAFINMVDVYVLSICDVLITAESTTGILAAHLRRSSSGLFCFRDGVVFPCTRELIAGSFRDQENAPVHLDKRYYMLKRKH